MQISESKEAFQFFTTIVDSKNESEIVIFSFVSCTSRYVEVVEVIFFRLANREKLIRTFELPYQPVTFFEICREYPGDVPATPDSALQSEIRVI